MHILDCPWEIENLNCTTAEISFDDSLPISSEDIISLEKKYDYLVYKVPVGRIDLNKLLSEHGYTFIETQISAKKHMNSFNPTDNLVSYVLESTSIEEADTEEGLNHILSNITEQMFDSDRIYLDPDFGAAWSAKRYKNWIKSSVQNGSKIYNINFNNQPIGFDLFNVKGHTFNNLLGGIYERYKGDGLGLSVPLFPLMYSMKRDREEKFTQVRTRVSSNNKAVIQLYNHLGYNFYEFHYVFTKKKNNKI